MHGFRLIFQHYGALDAILGHIPYLSRSFGFVGLCRKIIAKMSSHILIFEGFITSLLDGIHVILGKSYPLFARIIKNLFFCAYSPYREDESCYDIFGILSCFC